MDEALIKTVSNIQSQSINVKVINPVFNLIKNMINNSLVVKIKLYKVEVTFPALIPETIIII